MSQPITDIRRAVKLFGALQSNVDITEVSDTTAEWIFQHPTEAGRRFTLFLKNSAHDIVGEDLKITPHPFNPVKFLSGQWSIIPEEHDARNDAFTEVDCSKIIFETCLKDGETSITGEEKLKRLKANGNIRLGTSAFLGLWDDYKERKENSVLERLYREKGITYLDFFGDVLLTPHDSRSVLSLCRGGGVWHWPSFWLSCDWSARYRSASLASQV